MVGMEVFWFFVDAVLRYLLVVLYLPDYLPPLQGYAENLEAHTWVAHLQAVLLLDLRHSWVLTFYLSLTDLAVVCVLHLAENCLGRSCTEGGGWGTGSRFYLLG